MGAPRKESQAGHILLSGYQPGMYAWVIGARDILFLGERPENRLFIRGVKVTSRKSRKLFVHTRDLNPLLFAYKANALPMS